MGPHRLRIAAEVGDVVPEDFGQTWWHSRLVKPQTNEGGPGILLVRGTYCVAVPNPPAPESDRPFDVVVQVKRHTRAYGHRQGLHRLRDRQGRDRGLAPDLLGGLSAAARQAYRGDAAAQPEQEVVG
jgi:hypothetical protein